MSKNIPSKAKINSINYVPLFILITLFLITFFFYLYHSYRNRVALMTFNDYSSAIKFNYPRVFILDPKILLENKKKIAEKDPSVIPAYNNLIQHADDLLKIKPVSVMDKKQIPPSGDKHDYMSLAPYSWPDSNKQNGEPYIGRDGQINPERYSVPDYQNFLKMNNWSYTLALAYFFSNNEKYALKSADFLRVWFVTPASRMNPNLNFSQIVKGRKQGMAGGIIDSSNLPNVIDSIGLLQNSKALTMTDREALSEWFGKYLDWLQMSKSGRQIAKSKNNQATWYYDQVVSIAFFINKIDLAKKILEDSKIGIIATQIDSNGKQPQELKRTKSWDYSIFNLQGLCNLAMLGKNVHIDLWHYQTADGRSIKRAVEFLEPYADEKKVWPYQQITPWYQKGIITAFKQASIQLNDVSYWNDSIELEGKDAGKTINTLLFINPNLY